MKIEPVKRCIFCNSGKLTQEHFLPKWCHRFLSKNNSNEFTSESITYSNHEEPLRKHKKRAGNVFNKKFRVVCGGCNNDWMSQLEEAVKPALLAILENKSVVLSSYEQKALSDWITMKIMVAEQSESKRRVTPDTDIREFYSLKKIPAYFRIFIGSQGSLYDSGYIRHTSSISTSKNKPPSLPNESTCNTQTISFLLGPLFVHVFAAKISDFELSDKLICPTLHRIWPIQNKIIWPFKHIHTAEELSEIASFLPNFTLTSY